MKGISVGVPKALRQRTQHISSCAAAPEAIPAASAQKTRGLVRPVGPSAGLQDRRDRFQPQRCLAALLSGEGDKVEGFLVLQERCKSWTLGSVIRFRKADPKP